MRLFKDEEGNIITETQLRKEFEEIKKEQPDEYSYSFEEYVCNCTSKNGTLIEIFREVDKMSFLGKVDTILEEGVMDDKTRAFLCSIKQEIENETNKQIWDIIANNAKREFFYFKNKEIEKSKETIFANSHIISFYDELYEYLICTHERLDTEVLKFIIGEGKDFIFLLYEFYLKSEYASITTWDDITEMILEYYKKYGT